MKIFVCRKCQQYCNVIAALLSECCSANIFLPEQRKLSKARVNPAV